MLDIRDLTFTYAGADRAALEGVSLHVPEGQVCALVGANGAGKSTLCFALSGFVPHFYRGAYQGTVDVAGLRVESTTSADLAGIVGLVFQNPFNQISGARFSVREEVAFGLENLGVARAEMPGRIEAALARCGLTGLEERSPFALSGGQQQRLALATALAMQPRLLVLDEPTSQLDPAGTREIFATLRAMAEQGGTTVVLAEHKLAWVAEYAHRVVALADGRVIADGEPRAVLASPALRAHGVGETRYTRLARRAQAVGLAPAGQPLPVTLAQAVEFLR